MQTDLKFILRSQECFKGLVALCKIKIVVWEKPSKVAVGKEHTKSTLTIAVYASGSWLEGTMLLCSV